MRELMPLVEQYCIYSEHLCGLSKNYITSIKGTFKVFITTSNIQYLEQCTQESIERWLLTRTVEMKWKPTTFRTHHVHMRVVFEWLREKNMVTKNPLDGIRKPKLSKWLPKSISLEDAERVLACVKSLKCTYYYEEKRNYAMLALMMFTGVRRWELVALKMEDVNLQRMMISVIEWKGNKDRIIPISSRLAIILIEYIADRNRLNKQSEYFFTGSRTDGMLSVKWVDSVIKRVRTKSKIYFSAHSLRHSFATLMLEGGCDIYSLSQMMWHSKITTTTIYLSCSPRMMFSCIEKHPLN